MNQQSWYGTGTHDFISKAYKSGDEPSNQEISATVKLWSSKLRHTFTIKGKGKIIPESVKGLDTEFLPDIALGSAKYPCTAWVNISFNHQDYGLEYSQDDMMAVKQLAVSGFR